MVTPSGRPSARQVYGAAPPVARGWSWPTSSPIVVVHGLEIESSSSITVQPKRTEAVLPPLSVTVTVTVALCGPCGVPEITPLDGLIFSPVGRPVADQLSG